MFVTKCRAIDHRGECEVFIHLYCRCPCSTIFSDEAVTTCFDWAAVNTFVRQPEYIYIYYIALPALDS